MQQISQGPTQWSHIRGPTHPRPHHQCFIEYLDLQIKVTEFYSNFPPCFSLLNIHLLALYSHV